MENLKSICTTEQQVASSHPQQGIEELCQPTDIDLETQFPMLVEQCLSEPCQGRRCHYITVLGELYQWTGNHYRAIRKTDLERQIVNIAKTTTATKKDGEMYHPFANPIALIML